jgi:hypothetical protein
MSGLGNAEDVLRAEAGVTVKIWAKPVLTSGRKCSIKSWWECLGKGKIEPPGPAVAAGDAGGMMSIGRGSDTESGVVRALDRERLSDERDGASLAPLSVLWCTHLAQWTPCRKGHNQDSPDEFPVRGTSVPDASPRGSNMYVLGSGGGEQ